MRDLRTGKVQKILKFLSPCWKKKYFDRLFSSKITLFEDLKTD